MGLLDWRIFQGVFKNEVEEAPTVFKRFGSYRIDKDYAKIVLKEWEELNYILKVRKPHGFVYEKKTDEFKT